MIKAIFYVFAFCSAVAALTICPKTTKKINLLVNIMFSYVTVLCIGALEAFLVNLAGIPIGLISMGISYVLIAAFGLAICILKKRIQKFFVNMRDIFAVFICILIVGMLSLYIFTPYIHLNYYNAVDPSNHYLMAMRVVRDKTLSGMFFAPLYNGMIIGLFQWCLPVSWTYKAFILADVFHTIMEFLFFYVTAVILLENTKKKWIPIAVSILYWCGYPLFSFAVGGYVYWGIAVMLIEYVLLLLRCYEERGELKKTILCLAAIGCFAVSICYIQLAPGIFLTFFGVVVYHAFNQKKLKVTKKNLLFALLGICVAVVCALIGYHMVFASRNIEIFKQFKVGSMDTNALELLIFCPVVICIMLEVRRRKEEWNVFHISIFVYIALQLIMTLMSGLGMISTYYLFKSYIVLWFLVFAIMMEKGDYLENKAKQYLKFYILGVLCFLTLSYDGEASSPVSVKHSIFMQSLDVFVNKDFSDGYMSDNGKLYLLQYAMEKMENVDTPIPIVATNERKGAVSWYRGMYERGRGIVKAFWSEEEMEAALDETGAQYFIVFFDDLLYREQLGEYLDTYERVYENDNGFIAKRY